MMGDDETRRNATANSTSIHSDAEPSKRTNQTENNVTIVGGSVDRAHFGDKVSEHNNYFMGPTTVIQHSGSYVPPQPPLVKGPNNGKKLTDTIIAYTDRPISRKARVYPGTQDMGLLKPRDIAIKVTQYTDRKLREAQNLVKLQPHSNVVSVIHADYVPSNLEKTLYIAMEMCNPLTLEEYIQRRKKAKIPFSPTQAVDFSKQLIEGMNHIHQNNIIHRDLKPGSVLFSACGKFLKIIDFGMSKALKNGCSVMSVSTLPIGTDGYRAPETYNEGTIKKESDVFSLAILLYHVWSYGGHPFGDISLWSYNIKENKDPVLAGLLVPDEESAEELLRGMLANEPADRSDITAVREHPFNSRPMNDTLTKSVEALWAGSIESANVRAKLDNCVIYKESDLDAVGINASSMIKLNIVPGIGRDMLCVPVEKKPDGYLGIKQACFKCLREELKDEKSMAWIDVFDHHGKRIRVLLLIRPPGYDELFGVLVKNPERLVSECERNLRPGDEISSDLPVGVAGVEEASEGMQLTSDAEAEMSTVPSNGDGFSLPGPGMSAGEFHSYGDTLEAEMTPHQAEPSLNVPIGTLALISWWIHDPSV